MNAGGVSFDVTIGKISESIANTKKLTASLVRQDAAIKSVVSGYDKQRTAGRNLLAANKRLSSFNKTMLKGIYDIRKASRDMVTSTAKQTSTLKLLHSMRLKYNRVARDNSGFLAFSRAADATTKARISMDKLHASALKMNAAWKANTMSRMSRDMSQLVVLMKMLVTHTVYAGTATNNLVAKSRRLSPAISKTSKVLSTQVSLWTRLKTAMAGAGAGYNTWWKRFGVIAIGFAVAYRAIYAFQMAVSSLSRAFFGGLTVMDDYREGLATIAGMIALTYESSGTYSDRFVAATNLMGKSMENAMRLAPKYRMSMEEITAGFRELAQFGVVVTPEETERTLNTLATIKEISLSSGSTTKQIRQEVQALFQGQARVTDQFTRMIKITMPELYRTLQDGALSTTEKWNILTEQMWDFNQAVRESNQTVKNQALIAKGTLQIISKMAVEHSGVFGRWVTSIRDFNEKLFDTEGKLLPLGQKIEEIFADIWTSVDYSVKAIIDLGNVIKEAYKATKQFLEPWKDIIKVTMKTVVTLFVLRTVMQMTVGLATTLLGVTGLGGLVKILAMDISKMSFVLGLQTVNKTLGALLVKALLIPAAFTGAFALTSKFAPEIISFGKYITVMLVEVLKNVSVVVSTSMMAILESIASMPFKVAVAWVKSFTAQTNDLDASSKIFSDGLTAMFDDAIKAASDAGKATSDAFAESHKKALAAAKQTKLEQEDIYGDSSLTGTLPNIKKTLLGWKDELGDMLKLDFTSLFGLDGTALGNSISKLMDDASKILGDGMVNLTKPESYYKYGGADRTKFPDIGTPKADGEIDYKKQIIALDRQQLGITNDLAKLTTSVGNAEIDKTKGLATQISLKSTLLDLNMKELDIRALSNDDGEASEEYNKQLKVVQKLRRELELLKGTYAKINEQPWEAFSNGMTEWANGVDTVAQGFNKLGKEIIPDIASGWSTVWGDVFSGEITSFSDLFDNVMLSLQDSFEKAMTKMVDIYVEQLLQAAALEAASGIGSMLGSMFGSTASWGTSIGATGGSLPTAVQNSSGTIVGMASGGIIPEHVWGVGASGQQYEFGENGPERVLSNSDSFATPAAPQVTVNVINKTSKEVNASQGATSFDGRRFVVEAILEDIDRGGPLRSVMGTR